VRNKSTLVRVDRAIDTRHGGDGSRAIILLAVELQSTISCDRRSPRTFLLVDFPSIQRPINPTLDRASSINRCMLPPRSFGVCLLFLSLSLSFSRIAMQQSRNGSECSGIRVNPRHVARGAREMTASRARRMHSRGERESKTSRARERTGDLRRRGNLPKVHVRWVRTATSNYSGMLLMLRARAPRSFALRLLVPSAWFLLFFLFFFLLRCARGVNDMCRERIPNGTPRASHFFSRQLHRRAVARAQRPADSLPRTRIL